MSITELEIRKIVREEINYFIHDNLRPPAKPSECKIYIDYGKDQLYNKKMVHPCSPLQDVMKEPKNFQLGSAIEFHFLKFEASKIKYCCYCGVKFE